MRKMSLSIAANALPAFNGFPPRVCKPTPRAVAAALAEVITQLTPLKLATNPAPAPFAPVMVIRLSRYAFARSSAAAALARGATIAGASAALTISLSEDSAPVVSNDGLAPEAAVETDSAL